MLSQTLPRIVQVDHVTQRFLGDYWLMLKI